MKKSLLVSTSIIVFIVSSCKKKLEIVSSVQSSIKYNEANMVLNYFTNPTKMNLDIDKDGTIDFTMYMNFGYSNPLSYQYFCNIGSLDSNLISIQPVAAPVNDRIRIYSKGAVQDTLNSIWKPYTFLYHKAEIAGTTIDEETLVTNGDVYTAFILKKNGAHHYGWMRMACMTDYKTVHIKDWAYDTIPNKPIQIGQL